MISDPAREFFRIYLLRVSLGRSIFRCIVCGVFDRNSALICKFRISLVSSIVFGLFPA